MNVNAINTTVLAILFSLGCHNAYAQDQAFNSTNDLDEQKFQNIAITLPLKNIVVNSGFGWRKHPRTNERSFHEGVDLAARSSLVSSVINGKVEEIGFHKYLGNFVTIKSGAVMCTYGHLSLTVVRKGDEILRGNVIGVTGSTGRVTGEHLHFVIRINNRAVNPLKYLLVLAADNLSK